MAAYHPAAIRALPLLFLLLQEFFHPVGFNVLKVFNRAGVISLPVNLIPVHIGLAGELFTFMAETHAQAH